MAAQNKNRKYGRMKVWCKVYSAAGRAERNKKRRIRRHQREVEQKRVKLHLRWAHGKPVHSRIAKAFTDAALRAGY